MFKLFVSAILFSVFILFSTASFAQSQDGHVIHIQTWKMSAIPMDDDATAFADMMQRQTDALSSDSRLVSFRAVRHNWGADSRDFIMISEFKSLEDLFSFYDDMGGMLEKAFSKEQMDKDDALFNKYAGHHSDEIYRVIAGTK